jgi:hypothetical protein
VKPITTSNLKPIATGLKPIFKGGVTAELKNDGFFKSKYTRHRCQFDLRTRNAAKALDRLPEPGEVFTLIMRGNFSGFDFVTAIMELAGCNIQELCLATYGFSQRNSGQILDLLDAGRVKHLYMICSTFTARADAETYEALHKALTDRGQFLAPARNHSKLIGIKLVDGRCYCIDGSLNMRSARMIENAHVWNDPELYEFYKIYIKDLNERTETETKIK